MITRSSRRFALVLSAVGAVIAAEASAAATIEEQAPPKGCVAVDFGDRSLGESDRPARATPRRMIRTEP